VGVVTGAPRGLQLHKTSGDGYSVSASVSKKTWEGVRHWQKQFAYWPDIPADKRKILVVLRRAWREMQKVTEKDLSPPAFPPYYRK